MQILTNDLVLYSSRIQLLETNKI